jgi:alkylation response protein AidB-like acyl-CoA dehydrogenase
MDYSLTKEQQVLKQEFIDFFEEESKKAPHAMEGGMEAHFEDDEAFAYFQYMLKRRGEKGYHSMAWPKEYGGVGTTREYDVGLFYRRAKSFEFVMGDTEHHNEKLAQALGL